MKRKKNYVMRKRDTPKRVSLPDERTFLACYERVPRSEFLPNIILRRKYNTRAAPRVRRRPPAPKGSGIFSTFFLKKPKTQ